MRYALIVALILTGCATVKPEPPAASKAACYTGNAIFRPILWAGAILTANALSITPANPAKVGLPRVRVVRPPLLVIRPLPDTLLIVVAIQLVRYSNSPRTSCCNSSLSTCRSES